LTIGVGFLMESAIYQVARQYPNQNLLSLTAPPKCRRQNAEPAECSKSLFKEQESGYLAGSSLD
jgi:basic membrane lipoprotein Med (substrate-binding protein (PBP1-ABC) superfamily)